MAGPRSLYTLDILNQAQGPFDEDEIRGLADEHEEILVYHPASGEWRTIADFTHGSSGGDAGHASPGRISDFRAGHSAPRKRIARAIEEILGLCQGIIADGVVNERELGFLDKWCHANPEMRDHWPVAELVSRIRASQADSVITPTEQRQIERVIRSIVGATPHPEDALRSPTRLPVDLPEPEVVFTGKRFALAGEFIYGDRERIGRAITEREGIVDTEIGRDTDYLIVGLIGVDAWKRTPWGAIVERAALLREQGGAIAIVVEDHWARHLRRPRPSTETRPAE